MARPFRYTFILVLVAVGTALAAVGGWRYARASAPVNGPIVLISIESLRADRLPAYGYPRGRTPAIDALAADGTVFERAYSQVPQILPAHAALLTGRLPFDTRVRDSVGFLVPAAERLLPEMLRDRGYTTGAVVSSPLLRKETGINQGFVFFDGPTAADDFPLDATGRDGGESERLAEHWLETVGTSRAFLWLQIGGPRARYVPTDHTEAPQDYNAAVTAADDIVGRLTHFLKARQLYDQATLIVTGDHGEGLGDHGEQQHALLVYEEALHVPLVVKLPGGGGARTRVKTVVQHVDIVPTVLDLAKAPNPGNLRGHSLMTLIERNAPATPPVVYGESLFGKYHFGWAELVTITDGRYRYIDAPTPELYDLEADPGQHSNIVNAKADVTTALRAKLKALTATAPAQAPKVQPVSPDEQQRYERLGYVGTPFTAAPADAPAIDPKTKVRAVEQYRAAIASTIAREWSAAVSRFSALAKEEPGMPDVWMHLASAATRDGRDAVALDAFRHAAALQPGNRLAALGAMAALVQLKQLDDAKQQAQALADEEGATPDVLSVAHEILARVALARRNLELARAEADRAEQALPERPVRAYIDGRIAFDQRRYATALELFEPALEAVEKTNAAPVADLRVVTAEALLRTDRLSEAEYWFLEELKNGTAQARARAGLATIYRQTGRADEAAALTEH